MERAAQECNDKSPKRKLRCLIITLGGERQKYMATLFAQPFMQAAFDPPTFVPGIPARQLRNRQSFLTTAHAAGLLPDAEWRALEAAMSHPNYTSNDQLQEHLFDCLQDVPVVPGRQGASWDIAQHYSVELWRKARSINRGRGVLACTLAHLQAGRILVDQGYDMLLEDNVRACYAAERLAQQLMAKRRAQRHQDCCHLMYFGWLGSIPNLRWMYEKHVPRCCSSSPDAMTDNGLFAFPSHQDMERDYIDGSVRERCNHVRDNEADDIGDKSNMSERRHGGNPVWGSFAYFISREAYDAMLHTLRHDVGALLWKPKRARYYSVKPVDKILPRHAIAHFGRTSAVQLCIIPLFVRAPMLTSKIHSQWDPSFCQSTTLQLQKSGDRGWNNVWLTETERRVVEHYKHHHEWLTPLELQELQR